MIFLQQHIEIQIRQLQKSLDEQILRLEICRKETESLKKKIATIGSDINLNNIYIEPIPFKTIAIANGKTLLNNNIKELKEEDYDIVLDYTKRILKARKCPEKSSKLEECYPTNFSRERMRLLRYMLEHPNMPICKETITQIYDNLASMTSNTLAKTIVTLRRCLWNAPYILTEKFWGETMSKTGSVYVLNEKYNYLVIRYKI
jgi:hypothetical protein